MSAGQSGGQSPGPPERLGPSAPASSSLGNHFSHLPAQREAGRPLLQLTTSPSPVFFIAGEPSKNDGYMFKWSEKKKIKRLTS